MLLCAAGACLSHIWKNGPLTLDIAGIALLVPVSSALLFVCISLGVPDLYAVNSLRFPLNLTLPAIYVASLMLTMTLISRVGLSITRIPDKLAAINVWASGWLLGSTFVAGVVCLSILGILEHDRKREEGEDRGLRVED